MFGWQKQQDTLLLEVMREILAIQKTWTSQMLLLEEEKLRLERLRLEGASPLSDVPMGRMWVDEGEQDLDWALKTGLVTPGEYEDLLSKAGLASTDIEFI